MQIAHFEKGLSYTDKDLMLVARKLGKMATYCGRLKDESSMIRVETELRETKKENDSVKVMLTVELPKKVLRSESRKASIQEAFDRACEKMEPQLLKYKDMHSAKGRIRKSRANSRSFAA